MKAALLAALTGCAGLASCTVCPALGSAASGTSSGGSSTRSGSGGSHSGGSTSGSTTGPSATGGSTSSGSSGSTSSGSFSGVWACPLPGFDGFAPQAVYGLGDEPSSVVLGDFNGDGKPDLAITDPGATEVYVFLNLGDGGFGAPSLYPAGAYPRALVAADFNGDGWLDLALANGGDDHTAEVLLNAGDGTFGAPVTFVVGVSPQAVAVGDFNGDGRPDLAIANLLGGLGGSSNGTVSVLFNVGNWQGDGGFAPQVAYPVGNQPQAVAVGDFDGDGRPDLAVANAGDGTVGVLQNNLGPTGTGGFAPQVIVSDAGGWPGTLAAGDLNGDGKPDLVVANMLTSTVGVLLNQGVGVFAPQVVYPVGNGPDALAPSPDALALGDLGGTGRLDLVVANSNDDTVSVLLNTGNWQGDGGFAPQRAFAVGGTPCGLALGDLNGDGRLDVAVANLEAAADSGIALPGELGVLINLDAGTGAGGFGPQELLDAGPSPDSVVLADFNGDGRLDLAVANEDGGTVSVFFNQGDGGFGSPLTFPVGDVPQSLVTADFDGDGRPDLAVSNYGDGTVGVLHNNGGGNFAAQITFAAGAIPLSVAVGDFNGDGKPDLAVGNSSPVSEGGGVGTVSVLLNDGNGGFAAQVTYAVGRQPISLAVGDFNRDGKPDLAVANAVDGTVGLLMNTGDWLGDGGFAAQVTYAAGNAPGGLAAGDLDGDGLLDLAVTDYVDRAVVLLVNQGAGVFAPQATYPAGNNPQGVAVGDLDRTGRLDLVLTNHGDNTVSVLLNQGGGTFAPQQTFAVGVDPVGIAVGDFDGDGRLDLAVTNLGDNSVSVLRNGCMP